MLSRDEIHASLREMGIQPSDTVLMHTSMRAIGPVEGGCDGLIDAFTSYLSEGLYLVPTHTWANVGEEAPVFDVKKTPPCIGALPTVAAARRDGVRSLHPTHSMVAFGAGAAAFVAGEEKLQTPCPPGGCMARLSAVNAKLLLVGVGLNRCTFLHAVDEKLNLPDRLTDPMTLTVVGHAGERYTLSFRKHGETGSENFGVFFEPLAACGALTHGRLGGAEVLCCDAARTEAVVTHLWQRADYDLCKSPRRIPVAYYEELLPGQQE